jgi:hypothetical protein
VPLQLAAGKTGQSISCEYEREELSILKRPRPVCRAIIPEVSINNTECLRGSGCNDSALWVLLEKGLDTNYILLRFWQLIGCGSKWLVTTLTSFQNRAIAGGGLSVNGERVR